MKDGHLYKKVWVEEYFPIGAVQSLSEFAPRCEKRAHFLVSCTTMIQTHTHSTDLVNFTFFSCELLTNAPQPMVSEGNPGFDYLNASPLEKQR